MTGRRMPACRLVLPPAAAVELINRMQQIAAALTQAGVLRPIPAGRAAPARPANSLEKAYFRAFCPGNHIKKSLYMRCGPAFGLL